MAFLRYYVSETGSFPTKARIARQFGHRNHQSARETLERLVAEGHLTRIAEKRSGNNYGWRYELAERTK